MTIPKIVALSAIGLGAWLTPVLLPMDNRIEGFSLTLAPICLFGAAAAAQKEAQNRPFEARAREQSHELLATELEVAHELALQERYALLYPEHGETYPDPQPQPQLTGAHLHQPHLPTPGENPGETEEIAWDWATIAPLILTHPATLLVGAQGAGKTTLAQWVVNQKLGQGEEVVVLDPHWAKGEWPGCQIVGAGQNYTAIDDYLTKLLTEVKNRYRQREQGTLEFSPLTLVCEELTQWGDRVKAVEAFMLSSMSDFRKVGIRAVFLSHGKTNKTMGDGKGLAATREATLITLELRAKPTTEGPRPSGWAILSVPGFAPTRIQIPDLRGFSAGEPTPAIVAQPAPPTQDHENGQLAHLDRCLSLTQSPAPWVTVLIDLCRAKGGEIAVRDAQRSPLGRGQTADHVRNLLAQAEAWEVGSLVKGAGGEITGFKLIQNLL